MGGTRDETLIRDKVEFFRKSAFWPLVAGPDAEGWLANFKDDDKTVALALLDSFLYFSSELTSKILASEFHRLSEVVCPFDMHPQQRRSAWRTFRSRVVVSYPTDEEPGATDSGRSYLRKARGVLGLKESQYADPADAIARLNQDPRIPILLIDDFVGTGSQVIQTWKRAYNIGGGLASFADFTDAHIFYIPVLSTERARRRINIEAPTLHLRPGHLLTEEYSVFHEKSIMWPEGLQPAGIEFVRNASKRAGIPMGNGAKPDDWCGFGSLGLCVALDDTIPDASLTLFYWEKNGWRPLKYRP